jgi:hypothetical protein
VSETRNLRRYAIRKRRAAEALENFETADVWAAKQREIAATPLPDDFPNRERLTCLFYEALEDFDGADEQELAALGFSTSDAQAILAAAAALLP